MNFRQIVLQYTPVDCKNKLNDLLAAVEWNFGVFSPDMELDIRSAISKDEVRDYFDRIIHEAYPVLEYDVIKKGGKSSQESINKDSFTLRNELTPRQKLEKIIISIEKKDIDKIEGEILMRMYLMDVEQKNSIDSKIGFMNENSFDRLSSSHTPRSPKSKESKFGYILGWVCIFLVIIGTGILIWGLSTHNHFISDVLSVAYVGIMMITMYAIIIGIILCAIFLFYKSSKKSLLFSINVLKKISKNNSPYLMFSEKNNLMKKVIVCNVFLLLLCIAPMPYDYYILVRFFSMAVFSIMAFNFYTHKKRVFSCVFAFLALLFQPFVRIELEKVTWNIIDIAVAGFLLFIILKENNKE